MPEAAEETVVVDSPEELATDVVEDASEEEVVEDEVEEEDPKIKAKIEAAVTKAVTARVEAERKKNQENKTLRARIKALEPLETANKAKADADKTDLDRAVEELATLKTENAKLVRASLVSAVLDVYELPAKVLAQLEGDTAEELLESATEWAEDLGIERKDKPAPVRRKKTVPAADADGGLTPDAAKTPTIASQIAAATAAGDWKKVSGLKVLQLVAPPKKP